jgi:ribosomal protein S18 acetylase RimI-like enzyme
MTLTSPERVCRALEPRDRDWVAAMLTAAWGSTLVARRGEVLDAATYPGFLVECVRGRIGLAIRSVVDAEYEVLSLTALVEGEGVGTALMKACFAEARSLGCRRVWLTTTNNNTSAIAFYQRLGMRQCDYRPGAVALARQVKPSIPLRDAADVAIEHELDFELLLN